MPVHNTVSKTKKPHSPAALDEKWPPPPPCSESELLFTRPGPPSVSLQGSVQIGEHGAYWDIQRAMILEMIRRLAGRAFIRVSSRQAIARRVDTDALRVLLGGFGQIVAFNTGSWIVLGDGVVLLVMVSDRGSFQGLSFNCWMEREFDTDPLTDVIEAASKTAVDLALDVTYGEIRWYYKTSDNIHYSDVTDVFDDVVFPEAYPYIRDLPGFVDGYLRSDEQVLILLGPPGTGKTRLIRHIIRQMLLVASASGLDRIGSPGWKDSENVVMYTTSHDVLTHDKIYMDFLTEKCLGLVLEDMDLDLRSRKDGNDVMSRLLSASDGIIANTGKKIILSTNLHQNQMDDALIRDGRCFARVNSRGLTRPEAESFLAVYGQRFACKAGEPARVAEAGRVLSAAPEGEWPLGVLYKLIRTGTASGLTVYGASRSPLDRVWDVDASLESE